MAAVRLKYNLFNEQIGKLRVNAYLGGARWAWRCDCGRTGSSSGYQLAHGEVLSCGHGDCRGSASGEYEGVRAKYLK